MATWNPFRRQETRTVWGYTFPFTPDHPAKEDIEHLKFSYDRLGEDTLTRLNEISPPPTRALPRNNSTIAENGGSTKPADLKPVTDRDLYAILEDHHAEDPTLTKFWNEIQTVPEWVDWDQIARGQDVFYRYGGPALTGLTYQSLLGGMGAARVVETLARTGGFAPKVARRRLFETTQHILQCTKSLESLQPGGAGFKSSIRVRLLHAAVRQRILKLREQRSEYYDVDKWGIPINDLDSIGTIATFSSTLIWLSFPRQGIYLRQREIEDYIALWRYIAYLVGTPTEPWLSTPAKARAIMEALLMYEIQPSELSKTLANNIILCLEGQPPGYTSADMLTASARWLNGDDLADQLGLPRPGFYYNALMAGQCIFFMFMCYTTWIIPSWDRKKLANARKLFYHLIVESKVGLGGNETKFNFKWVPEWDTVTEMGGDGGPRTYSSIEARNLKALLMATGLLAVTSWIGVKIASMVLNAGNAFPWSLSGSI